MAVVPVSTLHVIVRTVSDTRFEVNINISLRTVVVVSRGSKIGVPINVKHKHSVHRRRKNGINSLKIPNSNVFYKFCVIRSVDFFDIPVGYFYIYSIDVCINEI